MIFRAPRLTEIAKSMTSRHAGARGDVTLEVRKRNNGLGPAAVWAEHLGAVGEEATANQRRVTAVADETFAVPVTVVERNELRSAQSYNDAACTSSVTTAAAIDITRGRLGFQVDSASYPSSVG